MKKNTIIKGTLILTLSGILVRALGFLYRIYLAEGLGARNLGVYQMVFPVYGICYTIFAGGIQTSLTRCVAAQREPQQRIACLYKSVLWSLMLALTASVLLFLFSDPVASLYIGEASAASSLRVLSFAFPFAAVTACLNGYYLGISRPMAPAVGQLAEQLARIGFVMLMGTLSCRLAVLGVVIGEAVSMFYHVGVFLHDRTGRLSSRNYRAVRSGTIIKPAVPLTANRLFVNILHSAEAVMIPLLLRRSGLTEDNALAVYGTLTGMALPLLLFPSTIVSSSSMVLMPSISNDSAMGNDRRVASSSQTAVTLTLMLGYISGGIFFLFGKPLGSLLFHDTLTGSFITILSLLCPFFYVTTTLTGILNGLGKAHITFFNTVAGLTSRLFCLIVFVPRMGIQGIFIAQLVSQLLMTLLDFITIAKNMPFAFSSWTMVLKPLLLTGTAGLFSRFLYEWLMTNSHLSPLPVLIGCIALYGIGFLALTFCTGFRSPITGPSRKPEQT